MRLTFFSLVLPALLLVSACGGETPGFTRLAGMGSLGGRVAAADTFCTEGDKQYAVGETYPSADGCNQCGCSYLSGYGPVSMCTLMACFPATN